MGAVEQLLEQQNGHRNRLAGSMEAVDFLPDRASVPASSPPAPLRLNLGSGDNLLDGYVNIDRKTGGEVFPLAAYQDNSVDEILASHILEHFSHREQVGNVLREWHRVLKPGGLLRVAVPNFEWIARNYLAGKPVDIQGYVMGGHIDPNDRHGAIFDEEELRRDLRLVGFYDVRRWPGMEGNCSRLPVSLNLQGKKKSPLPSGLRIECAMSVPRLGFQDNFFCWAQALQPLGISPTKFDGAFWGQCLERVMTGLVPKSDYILTIDYDSVFTRDHVEHLIRLAVDNPEADAVAAVQLMRSRETILTTIVGEDGKPTGQIAFDDLHEKELIRANSAHFGLTLIRSSALLRMPHPWFMGVPNAAGQWTEGRTDDDTYFWQQWAKAGLALFLAPHVVVAHGQFMLTWPGRNMEPMYQHPSDFWRDGTPEGVWQ